MIAGDAVDTITQRVRDPSNNAVSRAEMRDVLNRIQTAVNASQGYVLETTPLTLTPGQAIYRIETVLPNLVTVTDVEFENRFLDQVPWRNLWKSSITWLTDARDPEAWAMVGKSLLVIYPVHLTPTTLSVKGPKITTLLTDDNINLDLRDEDADIVIDLTTAYFLLQYRDIQSSAVVASRAADKLGLQEDAVDEEMRIEKM